jgi:hypothetical protein
MKTNRFLNQFRNITMLFVIFSAVSCASISSFDQQAYTQTTSVKVDALNLMDLAKYDYATQENNVKEYLTKQQKIYEYEKNRPKNEITLKLWDKLLDKDGHLLGGFLNRWQTETKLNETFIAEEKKLVDKAFDQISGLESKKIKPSEISQ